MLVRLLKNFPKYDLACIPTSSGGFTVLTEERLNCSDPEFIPLRSVSFISKVLLCNITNSGRWEGMIKHAELLQNVISSLHYIVEWRNWCYQVSSHKYNRYVKCSPRRNMLTSNNDFSEKRNCATAYLPSEFILIGRHFLPAWPNCQIRSNYKNNMRKSHFKGKIPFRAPFHPFPSIFDRYHPLPIPFKIGNEMENRVHLPISFEWGNTGDDPKLPNNAIPTILPSKFAVFIRRNLFAIPSYLSSKVAKRRTSPSARRQKNLECNQRRAQQTVAHYTINQSINCWSLRSMTF